MSIIHGPGDLPNADIRFFEKNIADTIKLPESARLALDALRERVDEVRILVDVAQTKCEEAREDHLEAQRQKSIVMAHYGVSTEKRDEMESKRVKAHKNLMDLQDRRDSIGQRWQSQKRLLDRVEAYITSLRSSSVHATSPSIKFPSADRLLPEIDKNRNEILTLEADRHEILSKATPSAEIKVRARAEIEELARRGCPDVTYMINHGPSQGVIWPDYDAIARGRGIGVPLPGDMGYTRLVQAPHLPLLAWLFKDRMIEAIEAEIDANAEDEHSLTVEQRTKKLAEIDARVLAAERIDVALVRHAGNAVDYREDTDPRALLGIEGPPSNDD